MLPSRLLLATTNPNKIREIRTMLDGVPYEIVGLDDQACVEAPEETGLTFEENARLKALYYSQATGMPAIAEDSGLVVDALDGAPGIESARFAGAATPYSEKFKRLYAMLDERGRRGSTARFVCTLALAFEDRIVFEARGSVEGTIASEPRGAHGFGYDPIFFYPPEGRTLGEVGDDVKRAVSHRGAAFRQLREFLLVRRAEL
jgi:non-canonical purine NTP pyrophosphatase (RdgB/HAM1 family)